MDSEHTMSEAGSTIDGKYVVEHLLGRGGHGKVFRARQLSTGQAVAVKILELDPGLAGHVAQRRRARFRREMKICGRLDHPDVVGLVDYGEHEDSLYSVFELVPGRTLAQLLAAEGALTVTRTAALMRQLLDVLVHAHGHGVIHRDLKPSNLMIFDEEANLRLKVLDFGISAVPSGTSSTTLTRLTLSNEMVGTPAYAAPEQLRGDAPTTRTDLYAWGLVVLECLSGSCPMSGSSLGEIFQKQLSPAPVPIPAGLREHSLGTVLRWVLEKNPSRRARSASDVLARFDAVSLDDLGDETGYFVALEANQAAGRFDTESDLPATAPAPAARIDGEQRHVTALCCRLMMRCSEPVESALLDVYRSDLFAMCRATIEEFGGVEVAGLGDLALYYFGVPRARDTDARMAVRAALELSARVRSRSAALTAQSRVSAALKAGIHCGRVIAGDRGAEGAFHHGSVATLAIELALHDQGNLDSDERVLDSASITVSDAFHRLAARHGEFVSRVDGNEPARVELPWQADPVVTHLLIGESLSDVFGHGAAPMVGRDDELAGLLAAWRDSRQRGRVALIRGEAGIGKSRLAHEFRRVTRDEGQRYLTLRFLPEMAHVALGPLMELVVAELGFEPGQRPDCPGLAAALERFAGVEAGSAVPLLCAWMSVPLAPPFEPLPFSPQKQRAMLHALLVDVIIDLLGAASGRLPGYVLIEDLHWADPSTRDWLGHLFAALHSQGGFALMTARPEFEPRWDGVELLAVELQSLGPEQVAALVEGLPGGGAMTETLVEQIVERADGVPLFVEELARVFGDRIENAPAGADVPEVLSNVPATLRGLMASRLDALGSARETAQFAAALGREFDLDLLLASLRGKDEATVLADLDQMISAGIAVSQRRIAQPVYWFRHALLRDAAYESLTPGGRESVHGAICQALLDQFQARIEVRPELAALHLELAGRYTESRAYWLRAGGKAMQELAYGDAIAHFRRGLDITEHCPAGAARDQLELDLLHAICGAYINWHGFGAPELDDMFARIAGLLEHESTPPGRELPSLWLQCLRNLLRPELPQARVFAEQMLRKATALDNAIFVSTANAALSRIEFWMGNHVAASPYHLTCERLHDVELDKQAVHLTGEPPYIASLCFHTVGRLVEGHADDAVTEQVEGLALTKSYEIPMVYMAHKANLAWLHIFRGMTEPDSADLAVAHRYAEETCEYATRLGFVQWQTYAGMMVSAARVFQGRSDEVAVLRRLMDMWAMPGANVHFCWLHGCVAHGLLRESRFQEAETALEEARGHVERSSEHMFDSQLVRLEAELLAATGAEPEQVRDRLLAGLTIAEQQNARLFALYVANAILDLEYHDSDIDDRLQSVASWWRDTSQGRDLAAVQRLLARLQSNSPAGRASKPR